MNALKLWFFDMRTKFNLWRHQRRDPIPIWNKSIKKIEGNFGSGIAAFFVFTR
jgi:hypothetical protein